MKKVKSPYPKHLHNTHLIPPISKREKGAKPIQIERSDTDNPIIMSDGYKDFYGDGTRKTSKPYVYLREWSRTRSKYATIHREYMSQNTRRSA